MVWVWGSGAVGRGPDTELVAQNVITITSGDVVLGEGMTSLQFGAQRRIKEKEIAPGGNELNVGGERRDKRLNYTRSAKGGV